MEKGHEISEDQYHTAIDDMQKVTDKYIEQIDDLLKTKEKDIMEV